MGIVIDRLLGRLLGSLSTPPITIRYKEQLLFGECIQSRKVEVRLCLIVLFPCVV